MPSLIHPNVTPNYVGVAKDFIEYTNDDGKKKRFNCGQAAMASLIKYMRPEVETDLLMPFLELHYGPNNLFGYLGTSPKQIQRALREFGIKSKIVYGMPKLRDNLPAVVTYQFELSKVLDLSIPSAHWMMAYGCDDSYIYLTNWWDNRMALGDFFSGWNGWVLDLQNIRNGAIVVEKE